MELIKCCGLEPKYDCDNCGTEWLACTKCGFVVEEYGSESIELEWNKAKGGCSD